MILTNITAFTLIVKNWLEELVKPLKKILQSLFGYEPTYKMV